MQQREADIIAKAIRNSGQPLQNKKEITETICREISRIDQFFNFNRFVRLALHELPEGWPNHCE